MTPSLIMTTRLMRTSSRRDSNGRAKSMKSDMVPFILNALAGIAKLFVQNTSLLRANCLADLSTKRSLMDSTLPVRHSSAHQIRAPISHLTTPFPSKPIQFRKEYMVKCTLLDSTNSMKRMPRPVSGPRRREDRFRRRSSSMMSVSAMAMDHTILTL